MEEWDGPTVSTQITEGFRSRIWLWTTASRVWEPWTDLSKGLTWSELCWKNTDSEKSGGCSNDSFCQATWGEALGIRGSVKLPGKRSQENPAFVAVRSAQENAGTVEHPLAEKRHQ